MEYGRSWGEDLAAYATKKRAPAPPIQPPERYGRTAAVPFGSIRHPGYNLPYPDILPGPADVDRYTRHGWSTTQKFAGRAVYGMDTLQGRFHDGEKEGAQRVEDERKFKHTGLRLVTGAGANRPPPAGPTNPSGRTGLFETIQYSKPEAPSADTWMGNIFLDPSKGRANPPAPITKGRKDLFNILNHSGARKAGDVSGDSWIGNAKVDPFLGKATVPTPANRLTRKDLFATIQQKPPAPDDKQRDAWVGHRLIDPTKGKAMGDTNPHVVGTLIPMDRILANEFYDEKVEHRVTSMAKPCEIKEVLTDEPMAAPVVNTGRRVLEQKTGPTGRKGLFGIMAFDQRELSDVVPGGRVYLEEPGSDRPGKGRQLLYWNGAS